MPDTNDLTPPKPKPVEKAPPIPEAVPGEPTSIEPVPFQSHFILKQHGQQVQVKGWWSFPTREAAVTMVESLGPDYLLAQ